MSATARLCAAGGHRGATYNPWVNKTWCFCGEVIRDGNHLNRYRCECGATFHTEAGLLGHEAEHRPYERTKR